MTHDPKCPRCGGDLKIETVRIPVWKTEHSPGGAYQTRQFEEYETREDVSDCVRCTGSY